MTPASQSATPTAVRARVQLAALIRTWLLLDFFGDARRAGDEQGSSMTTTIMWQALLSFAFAMLLYPDTPPVAFVAANLSLSTLLVAVGTLGDDERPLRRLADRNLLAGAPVAHATVVAARAGHAAVQLVLVTTGMALPPALLLGHLTGSWLQAGAYVLAAFACTALANGALATVRAVLTRLFGTARATLGMGTLRAALLGGGFVLFALSLRRLDGTADDLPITRTGAELLPTYHAARLLAAPLAESWRLLPWALCACVMFVVSIGLAASADQGSTRVGRRQLLLRMLRRLTPPGPNRGVAEYVALSMWRSAGFRARVLPLFGLPAGMVFLTMSGDDGERHDFALLNLLLQLPAIYLPFLIAFLPRADQAQTGWIFAHAPRLPLTTVCDATFRALVTHVLLPIHAVAATLVVTLGPDRADRAAAALFAFGLAVLAARAMVRIDRVPFTEDREEDRGLELGGLMAGALLLGGLGAAFGGALPATLRWPVALAVTGLAAVQLRVHILPASNGNGEVPTAATGAPDAEVADAARAPAPTATPTRGLGHELRAVLVLYVILSILPWVAGAVFAA